MFSVILVVIGIVHELSEYFINHNINVTLILSLLLGLEYDGHNLPSGLCVTEGAQHRFYVGDMGLPSSAQNI